MARLRYTHKEHLLISNGMIVIILLLCFLVFDNWLGMTLAQNDALASCSGKCTKYTEIRIPKGRQSDAVFYDIYLDNGFVLSVPEDGLWDSGFHKYELPTLLDQEITVYYYPGIIPIPPARLVRAYFRDREIVTMGPTITLFTNHIALFFAFMIIPVMWLLPTLFWRLFQTALWQRNWPKIRKAIKQWRYRNRH